MLRIGELARIAGVTPRLLRHYEAIGIFAPAAVDARTRYRHYHLAYRDSGVPLSLIAQMSQDSS